MNRRTFLTLAGSQGVFFGGCLSVSGGPGAGARTSTRSETPTTTTDGSGPSARTSTPSRTPNGTPVPGKPGTVENHRITAVEAESHTAIRRTDGDGHEWVVTATLRLKPQDPEVATAYPVGVFVVFLDADGRQVYRVYETVPANTGRSSRTVTLWVPFDPDEATADEFHRYRIELVHP